MGTYGAFQKTIDKRIERVGIDKIKDVLRRLPVESSKQGKDARSSKSPSSRNR